MADRRLPAGFDLFPIDDAARSGRYQLVFGGETFALVRWTGERWAFSSGASLDFEPTHYQAPVHCRDHGALHHKFTTTEKNRDHEDEKDSASRESGLPNGSVRQDENGRVRAQG